MDRKRLKSSGKDENEEVIVLKQKLLNTEAQLKLSIEENEKRRIEIQELEQKLGITEAHLNLVNKMYNDQGAKIAALEQELKKTKAELKLAKEPVLNPAFNINSLPKEMIIEIFKHLTHNELGQISRVCRKWNICAKSPVLWKKVEVHFSFYVGYQSEIVSMFFEKLSSSITHLKFDFVYDASDDVWQGALNCEELCINLKKRCPCLHTLIFHYAIFSVSLPALISLCSKFLPNLKTLIISMSDLRKEHRQSHGHPTIEILDVSSSGKIGIYSQYSISKMPNLRKLNLWDGLQNNYKYFWEEDNVSFLHQLEVLRLGWADIDSRTFHILQNHALNLTHLFLCETRLSDKDFSFKNSVFPALETICLRYCEFITCEGIISLIKTCQSLQNVYVDRVVAESFVQHPFVNANTCKLKIVKDISKCDQHETFEFMLH